MQEHDDQQEKAVDEAEEIQRIIEETKTAPHTGQSFAQTAKHREIKLDEQFEQIVHSGRSCGGGNNSSQGKITQKRSD